MAAGDLHVGDQCVLAVVVLDHVGVARAQAALGAGGEPRAQRGCGAAGAAEAGDHVVLARGQISDLGLVEDRDARRVHSLAQRGSERACRGDVAERRQVVLGGVDQGTAEPALVRDVDVLDRGPRQPIPHAQALQREPGAVGEREVARVLRHRFARTCVGEHDVEPRVLEREREREREADRTGADDQQVMDAAGRLVSHGGCPASAPRCPRPPWVRPR